MFLPNPRGSTEWGLEFADPNRLGIAGWSYGGFMTAWAVTQTDRFKAAMMGTGIGDWRSFHGKPYLCDWDAIHYGDADTWDQDGGIFRRFSPIT